MQNNAQLPDSVAAKANEMAQKFAAHQAAQEARQQEIVDRMNRTADSIMPMLDGWNVAEIEVLLGQCVLARVKERSTYSTPTK